MVIHAQIIKQIFGGAVKGFRRYYALEGKAFNRLYTGFPQSKTIGRGVRHGLTAGSVVGSLITDADDSPGNGFQKIRPTQQFTPRKSYQARGGFTRRSRSRCPSPKRFNRSQ